MLSSAISLALAGTLAWGLLPLGVLGRRLLFLPVALLPLAMLFVRMDLIPPANVAKVVAAAVVGIWIAQEIERPSWVVAVAALSAAVDIVSVAVGPTRLILDHGPMVIGYFTVTMTWFGYSWSEAYSAIGLSDIIFLGLYLGAARRFGLRERRQRRRHGRIVPGDARAGDLVEGTSRPAAALGRLPERERGLASAGIAANPDRRRRERRVSAALSVSRRARTTRPSRCGASAGTCRPGPRAPSDTPAR